MVFVVFRLHGRRRKHGEVRENDYNAQFIAGHLLVPFCCHHQPGRQASDYRRFPKRDKSRSGGYHSIRDDLLPCGYIYGPSGVSGTLSLCLLQRDAAL